MATAASAAAIVMMKMTKKIPSSLSGYKYLLNATKLMFTLFNINSIAINIVIMLRRVNRPYMPMKNKAVLTNRICDRGTSVIVRLSLILLCGENSFIFFICEFKCLWYRFFRCFQFHSLGHRTRRSFHCNHNAANHCGQQ